MMTPYPVRCEVFFVNTNDVLGDALDDILDDILDDGRMTVG